MQKERIIMKKKVLAIFSIFIFCSVIFLNVDYNRLKSNKSPIFSIELNCFKDGGTISYLGFGYQLINWQQLSTLNGKSGYVVGVELLYFPFFKDWFFFKNNLTPEIKLEFVEVIK